jgi:hypothetical protein
MNPITSFLVFACVLAGLAVGNWVNPYLALVFFAAAIVIALALKMANVWQKFVILRLGCSCAAPRTRTAQDTAHTFKGLLCREPLTFRAAHPE